MLPQRSDTEVLPQRSDTEVIPQIYTVDNSMYKCSHGQDNVINETLDIAHHLTFPPF